MSFFVMSDHCIPLNKEVDSCKRFGFLNLMMAKAKSHKRKPQDSLLCRRAAERALLSIKPTSISKKAKPTLPAPSVCTGKIWVCQAQRNPWRCDAGERFSSVGEEPAPRQTGEPRAGAQGKKTDSEGRYDLSIPQNSVCIFFVVVVCLFSDPDSGVFLVKMSFFLLLLPLLHCLHPVLFTYSV